MRLRHLAFAGLAALTLTLGATAAPQAGALPGGTPISVELLAPAHVSSSPGTVPVTVAATVGGTPPQATARLVYVMDLSGSMDQTVSGASCGDQNPGEIDDPPAPNERTDCAILAFLNLHGQAQAAGTIAQVGIVGFADQALTADVGPTAGMQTLTSPGATTSGVLDVERVLRSANVTIGGPSNNFRLFSPISVGEGTNIGEAFADARALMSGATGGKIAIMVTDGESTAGPSYASVLSGGTGGMVFHAFIVGGGGSACTSNTSGRGRLIDLTNATGGTCTAISDPASLPDLLPDLIASQLTGVQLSIDGGPPTTLTTTPATPVAGPAAVSFAGDTPPLLPGVHELCATARGTDVGGPGSVTQCRTVTVGSPPTIPGAPVQISGTNPNNTGTYDLQWAPSSDADGDAIDYELFKKDADDAGYVPVAFGPANTYSSVNEAEGTWTYRATARSFGFPPTAPGPESAPIVVDKTPPNAPIASAPAPDFAPDWYLDSVTISFAGNGDPALQDGSAGSGVASVSGPQTFSTHGTHTALGTATDAAGNVSAPAVRTAQVDALPPQLDVSCPSGPLPVGAIAFASFSASDEGSGLATPAAGSIPLDTTTPGTKTASTVAADNVGHTTPGSCQYQVGSPPNCEELGSPTDELWPPNHSWHTIALTGATDPDGDALTYTVVSVRQDEPLDADGDGDTSPDARLVGGALQLRAERSGGGDGRVYHVSVQVSDGLQACSGTFTVVVPHNPKRTVVDGGALYDSFGS
ncbi:MAG TPA: vWA domain-containing protein [Actinomycetota bacterium]